MKDKELIIIMKELVRPVDFTGNVKTFAFSFDEKYVKYFSVTLLSLIAHSNPESRYEIIVFYDWLSREKKEIVKGLLPVNFSIRFICVTAYVNEIFGDIKSKVSSKNWDVSTFYDILVPLLMPEYERVLYCDSDIIFKDCPDEIFNIPFDGKKLIAVKDTVQLAILKHTEDKFLQNQVAFINQDIGIQDLRYYFNGGVLLFNNREIEREEYLDRALQALSFPLLPTADQDALNFIFKDEVKIISQRYNFQYHLLNGLSDNDLNNSIASEYFAAGRDPVIVHYTTAAKPWKKPSCALGNLFWKYAKLSPFYEEIIYENLTVSINESYEQKIKKLKAEFEQKHKEIEKYLQKYITARIDVKNFGTDENGVVVTKISDINAKIQKPIWFKNAQGQGCVIQSTKGVIEIEITCVGSGELTIWLRGMDCRNENKIRFPVWINYTCLLVNDMNILNAPKLVWHDRPFVYKLHVTDMEIIKIYASWLPSQDMIADERETYLKKNNEMQQEVLKTRKNCKNLDQELNKLKQSRSYRIGRMLTFIPRKLRDFFK